MSGIWIAVAALAAVGALALLLEFARRLTARDRRLADATIANLADSTSVDAQTGAVRSVQSADVYLDEDTLAQLWSPANLERLARTYWRFLTRVTLGLIRVRYSEHERSVVLMFSPLRLLTFEAPEYEIEPDHGVVRWRIARGLLVARAGRHGDGHLQIDVRRLHGEDHEPGSGSDRSPGPTADADAAPRLHVEVEVANFYPAIASGLSRPLYNATQSRIHVIVTHGFLRSLARLDLADSRVGRLAAV